MDDHSYRDDLGWLIAFMAADLREMRAPPFTADEFHDFYLALVRRHGIRVALADAEERERQWLTGVIPPLRRLRIMSARERASIIARANRREGTDG